MQTPLNEFLWLKTEMVNSNAYRGCVDTKKQRCGRGQGVRQEAVTAAKAQPVSSRADCGPVGIRARTAASSHFPREV